MPGTTDTEAGAPGDGTPPPPGLRPDAPAPRLPAGYQPPPLAAEWQVPPAASAVPEHPPPPPWPGPPGGPAPPWPPPASTPYGPPGYPPAGAPYWPYAPPYNPYAPYASGPYGPYNPYGPYASPYARPWRPGPAPGLVYANLGYRILAAIIDIVVLVAISFAWLVAIGSVPAAGVGAVVIALFVAGYLVALGMVSIWIPGRYSGTLGMRALGMRILREADGSQIGYALAAGRFGIYTLLNMLSLIGVIINLVVIAADDRSQAVQDKVCSTVVVRAA